MVDQSLHSTIHHNKDASYDHNDALDQSIIYNIKIINCLENNPKEDNKWGIKSDSKTKNNKTKSDKKGNQKK